MTTTLTLDQVEQISLAMLTMSGASTLQATSTAASIREAEADGIRTVGLSYLPTYCDHVACGKVVGDAVPTVSQPRAAVVAVDAHNGFAHPAFLAGLDALIDATRTCGIGLMSVTHSYSAGVLGWFVERVADAGLISIMFANSSSLMAPYGGVAPFFGTNPIAWASPRANGAPLVADLSSSTVAWVKVAEAAASNTPIPLGWALDVNGEPTTDPHRGLEGSMAPAAGHKGSALALLVDLLAAGVTDSNFSFEASGFGGNEGGPPDVGQIVIAIDASATAPRFLERVEVELAAMIAQPGVRLPGDRRLDHRITSARNGVDVPDDLMAVLTDYAQNGSPALATEAHTTQPGEPH